MTRAEAVVKLLWLVVSLAVGIYLTWWWWPSGITDRPLSSLTFWRVLDVFMSIISIPLALGLWSAIAMPEASDSSYSYRLGRYVRREKRRQ